MKKLFLIITALVFFSIPNYYQPATPGITKTQLDQQKRINIGIQSGELTRKEARRLKKQQAHIQKDKMIAKADGVVSKKERRHIKRHQKKSNKNIYHKKHNGFTRN